MMKIINMLVVYFTNVSRLGVLNRLVMLLLIVKLSIVIKVASILKYYD